MYIDTVRVSDYALAVLTGYPQMRMATLQTSPPHETSTTSVQPKDYPAKAATLVGRNVHLAHLDEELIGRGFRVVDLRAGGTIWTLGFRNRYGTTGTTT